MFTRRWTFDRFTLVLAAFYLFLAAVEIHSDGWRDSGWTTYALIGTSFVLVSSLPDDVRRSFRQAVRTPRGSVACALLLTAFGFSVFPLQPGGKGGEPNDLPDERSLNVATEAVTRFHSAVTKERYGEVCQIADPQAFRSITALPCAEFLAFIHQQQGAPLDATQTRVSARRDRLGTPTGVEVHYNTRYQRGNVREQFQWRITGSNASLISYRCDWDRA